MKITISETPSKGFCLQLPIGLILNGLAAQMLAKEMRKYGINISARDARLFMKAVKNYKKEHSDWLLAEVQSAKGEQIEIKL